MDALTKVLDHYNKQRAQSIANCDKTIDYHSKALIAERAGEKRSHYIKHLEATLMAALKKKQDLLRYYESRIKHAHVIPRSS
jgi:hypothetical protein